MKTGYLLGIACGIAVAVAACGDAGGQGSLEDGARVPGAKTPGGGDDDNNNSTNNNNNNSSNNNTPGGGATSNQAGKDFYIKEVHPTLAAGCGGCHGSAAGAGPHWITTADAGLSYTQLFNVGYVVQNSRIVMKGAHAGSTTNVLTTVQITKYNEWVTMEEKARGGKAPVNILEKFGTCLDETKFNAITFANLRTTRRTANNNTNNVTPWNENANNCTGCDQANCTMCHLQGEANFKMAVGSTLFPAGNTFAETKVNVAYLTKYIAVSPTGEPVASDMLKKKSDSTMKDKAYSHPMYTITPAMDAQIKAFTDDAIAKYKAGSCGK